MDLSRLIEEASKGFNNPQISTYTLITVLLMVAILSSYQYLVYRFISKRSFYSKQFNIAMAVMPLFIATIIMTLQSNLLITLGTIGALAIIRFRTAIKDPIDMAYLLWAIHTGVVCGCQLYEIGVLTSIVATIFLLVLDLLPLKRAPYLFVVNANDIDLESQIIKTIKKNTSHHKVKSRNLTKRGLDMIFEVNTKNEKELIKTVSDIEGVGNLSLVAYDGENFS